MDIDHVVLWVDSPKRALEFYVDVVGLEPERVREFEAGRITFPSVRLNPNTIIDLMDRKKVEVVHALTGAEEGGGAPVNHICLSMSRAQFDALTERLLERDVKVTQGTHDAFGARGMAADSGYFRDPDGNIVEIRHYDD